MMRQKLEVNNVSVYYIYGNIKQEKYFICVDASFHLCM